MLGITFLPVHHANCPPLSGILDQEERSWMADLSWDFSPIRRVLTTYLAQKLLPGYAAVSENKVLGYTYFLVHQRKGIVGNVYVSPEYETQAIADELLNLALDALKGSEGMRRIEAQIITFNNIQLTAVFTRNGFQYHPRYYLELDLSSYRGGIELTSQEKVINWDSVYIPHLAGMTLASYRDQLDAVLCEDYCSIPGCESYLRSVVDNPGCGVFATEASHIALDSRGIPCGFVLGSRISSAAGMIPQIAIAPSHQGHGLGKVLIDRTLCHFKAHGYRTVSLTVTKRNRRAFEWYQRLGFKIRREFGAYVWSHP